MISSKHPSLAFADTFRCDETLRKISEFRLSPEKSAEENAVDRRFQYIKGSVHQNTLDLPFIFQVSSIDISNYPFNLKMSASTGRCTEDEWKGPAHHYRDQFCFQFSLVKKFVGLLSETCPETVIDLNNKLMVQFLWKHLAKVRTETYLLY